MGETLTADITGIADEDGLNNVSYSYQWIRNGGGTDADIAGETASTYTLSADDEGKTIKVEVSFTDDAANQETLTSAETTTVTRPNSPATGAPTISGTAQAGETLTADISGIADEDGLTTPVFTYQWVAGGADISGATSSSQTLTASQQGQTIQVRVSFTDDAGNQESLTSEATAAAAPRSVEIVEDEAAPLWSADMLVVEYTSVSIGAASTDLFSNVGGSAGLQIKSLWYHKPGHELSLAFTEGVSGAEDLTLQVGDLALAFPAGSSGNSSFKWKDVDVDWEDSQTISVRIVPTSATITVPPNTPATGAPVITGTAQVDETLTADISGIADEDGLDDVSYNYQWIRSDNGADADIAGETDSTYTLVLADQGKTIKVKVSFTDDDDNEEALTSVATVAVASAPNREATGQPTIDGTPQVRETLTADTANIADQDGLTGVSYRYQWIAGGSDIDGATSSTYILTASEHGQTIQVKVSFTDDRNNAETLTSAATVAVAAKPNTAATGEPTISGTAQVGETLTADTSGIDDADGLTSLSYRYQWIAGGSDINGATGSSHRLTASQQGQTVQVKVTFTDDADNQESLTSAETLAVAARPNTSATGDPTISGTPQVEATLTADTSAISDEDGLANVSYQYQWLRDDADIAGQTNSTYRLVSADQGKTIRVRVTFADDRGNEETITSEPTTTVAPSNPQPEVVPRLQEWAGGSGNFALSASSRIVVSAGDGSKHFSDDFFSTVLAGRTDPEQSGLGETQRSAARLALADSLNATAYHTASRRTLDQVAAKIRDDIEDLTGLSLAVITASASISPQAGDVVVDVLDASSYTVAAEGYELAIGDWATIRANSTSGVFYGSRTLLQILAQSGNNTVPRGTARDYPTLGHRLIHLDMNRKYWEMDYLADSFRRMSWVKLNAFKIHFADANGWRLHDPGTAAWSGTMPAAPTPDTATEVLGSVSLGAPTGVKVLPGAGSLTVQWDPPNDQTDQDVRSYRVQIRRQGDLAWSPADYRDSAGTGTAYLTMTDRSHNFGGLTDGVTYEVRVSADTGFPGLADSKEQYQSGDKKWFYDREDIRLLEAWAAENHISIMPGFEFPGHTSVINNLYETGFADGGSDRCGNAHVYGNVKPGFVLDTTSSRAVAQAKTIMEHFMPWFSGPYVHIGGEEVSPKLSNCPRVAAHIRASSSVSSLGDMLTVFFNDLNQLVREMDKSMIIYNGVEHLGPDTNVAQLDSTVVVMDWNAGSYNYYGGAPGSTGARHKFMKMRASDGYYLTSNNFHALYPEESRLYDKWVVEPAETYLGAAIGVWLDYIYWSQDEYTELLLQRPRAILGDRTWNGSATPDTVDEFYARVQAIGEPPAYQGFTKRTRVNDGLPSHHYGFEDDTEVFPPTHFKNLRHGRIHLLRDEAGELHATSYNITSPSVRDDDKKFGASSWEFSKGGHGAGIGGVDIPAPWTMSIWVKRTADRVGAALMSSRSPTGDHRYIRLQRSGTQVGIDDRNGLGCSFDYSTPLNEWTHLAFVADTATITLYVDGVPQSATCASMPLPMGAISARGNDSLRAYLDELKIWDETLSRAQVERLAVSEAASLPGPLTGFTVVNASDQTTVEQLAEGATLTLDDPASGSYDIRVDTESGAQIGSVRLELSGRKTVSRTENITPYSLHGDGGDGGDGALHGEPLPAGSYTLRATAYEEQDLGGDVLGTLEVSFTLAAANTPATGALTIGGTAQAGATLTADTSGIADADGLVFSYQWIANDGNGDTDIVDATDPTYELSDDDIGQTIRVRVSFTDDGNTRESLTSAATGAVGDHINSLPTGAPVIIGTTEQGETLTADTSGITDIDGLTNAAFSYQWIRNGDTDGDTDIIDATDPTYELTSADLGRTIKVRVSFTDDAGNSESLTSAGTDEVGEAKLDPCSGGGYYPVPVDVAVAAVPIVVDSTTEEYFVLYVRPDLDSDREIPVSVTLGQNGTTTLTEQLSPLPREHYRVEKYLIADPSDVDGDCIDDIGELQDPVGLNPLNPAPAIPSRNGAVAIPDHETFEALSYKGKSVSTDIHLTDLEYVKFYLLGRDTDRPSVYFVNTVRHRAHIDFGNAIDLWEAPIWRPRWAMAGAIIYHPNVIAPDGSLGVYRYEFRPLNSYSFDSVAYSYEVLAASMPLLDNNLAYYPMPARASPLYREEKALYDDSRINVLFEEDILPDVDFIPLNLGEGYGFLRVMSLEERPNPRDIVIYETLPNELSRVAGIITTVPQTPLSHVNLRAVQDGVPNAFIRDALDDADIEDLVGGYVHYTVEESRYSIRAATRAEVDAHYAASSPSQAHSPERDLTVTQITALSDIEFEDWTAFGVKAANVAVLGALYFPEGTVPDGFAVPFYFYDEFMKHNEFYDDIEKMLADSDFQSDFDTQESELKKLRKRIKKGETPEWINTALTEMHAEFPAGTSLRYRSSTNNEDLPGFSGAGLYDSKTQHPEETEEDGISKSLKQVYASLWNFRAFTEREFHRIDHLAMAMGVLVHPNYSDELANGVAVSFDPVSGGDESYYVNTQVGEDLVTNPDAYSVPEEILLHQGGDYTVLATSNQVQRGQLLMSDAQMDQLRRHLEVIHDEFEVLYGVEADEPFAMEIEFKITSDDILSIKQARPWVFEAAPSENNPATGAPSIRGTAQVDQTLTADTSGIADADGLVNVSFSYQWIRNDGTTETDIENATSSTYTLSDTDVGETIKVRVSFTDDRGYEETLTSAATTAITGPNTPATGSPTISGTAQVDETLTADVSGVTDADGLDNVSYTYQWIANDGTTDTDIENATAATYTPVIDDQGKTIKVRVSFTDDANNSETLSSEATATVATASQWRADMSVVDYGTGAIGAASADLFSNVGGNAGLQAKWLWYYSPERKLRLAFTERVPGTEELTLQVGDVALALQPGDATYSWEDVDIDWEDGQTLTARIVRARANAVVAPNSPATGAPTINGTAQVGETLTADTSGIADSDGLNDVVFAYQWLADDAIIQGATNSTYTADSTKARPSR